MKSRIDWKEIGSFKGVAEYEQFRAQHMKSSSITQTRSLECRLCVGHHEMRERRLSCVSAACHQAWSCDGGQRAVCPVQWKVLSCKVAERNVVYVSSESHVRDENTPPSPQRDPLSRVR